MSSQERTKAFFSEWRWPLTLVLFFSLVIGIWASEGQDSDFNTLERLLFKAYKSKNYIQALEVAKKMYQFDPKNADTLYNISSLYCLLGDKEKALNWLEIAVETGGLRSFRNQYFERYIAMLEHPDREAYQKPDQVLVVLEFKPGDRVADIGAGSGYFTIRLAKAVGPTGIVWAIDVEQAMLDHIEERIQEENLQNVKLKLVREEDPQLPAGSMDTIMIVHTYSYLPNRIEYARKLRAALAPGGRVVIIDYIPKSWQERPWGPLPHQQVSRETVDEEMAKAGFKPIKVHNFLPDQYFVEYRVENKNH